MRCARLTIFAGVLLVWACGARTSVEDYGYRSTSRRTGVQGTGGHSGGGSSGSGGDTNGVGAAGVGGFRVNMPPDEPPPDEPPPDEPPPPFQPPPPQQVTCGQVAAFFDGQSVGAALSEGSGSFQSGCGGVGLEQHYSFVAPYTGLFTFDTFGSSFDTVLSIHDVDCFGSELICNDDTDGVSSRVQLGLNEGQQIVLRVDGYDLAGGNYVLRGHGTGDLSCANQDLGGNLGTAIVSGSLSVLPVGPDSVCGGTGPTLAATWVAPFDGNFQFDTIGSTFDTTLAVNASCTGASSLGCNDDFSGLASGVNLQLVAGQPVLLLLQALSNSAAPPNDYYQLNIQAGEIFF